MAIKYGKIHSALEKTGDYRHLSENHHEEIDTDVVDAKMKSTKKKVKPAHMDDGELREFKERKLTSLQTLCKWFKVIQSVIDLRTARDAFSNARIHPTLQGHSEEFESRLLPTHALVKNADFESEVEKILLKKTEDLTTEEKTAAECLLKKECSSLFANDRKRKHAIVSRDDKDIDPSSPTRFLKQLEVEKLQAEGKDMMESSYLTDLSLILPSTVIVERLFSICRHILTYDRQRMFPHIFESIVFLKIDENFWSPNAGLLIHEMENGRWDDHLGAEYNSDDESDVGED